MEQREGVTIAVLAERLKAVQEDVSELRQIRKDDHHRLRSVESSVAMILEAQTLAREAEERHLARLGTQVALGGLAVAIAMVALTIATILINT